MILRFKRSVDQSNVAAPIWFACGVVYMVFAKYGIGARVTSMRDPSPLRVPNSLHLQGFAVDFGARALSVDEEQIILRELQDNLEHMGFDVLLHGDPRHYHVEYDPKKGEGWQKIVDI